jgi:histidine phosphotransferase ChpT
MSGTHGALRLIELASARLCEAIDRSISLLDHALSAGAGDTPSEKAALHAAKALKQQLSLRRAAWEPVSHPIPLAQVAALAQGLPDNLEVDVSALPPATLFPSSVGRIVLNFLLLSAESLPAGGRIALAGAAEDLFVRIAGPAAAWPTSMALCLADETEARSALTDGRNLQMALTALLAHAAGIRLSLLLSPTVQTEPPILRLGG